MTEEVIGDPIIGAAILPAHRAQLLSYLRLGAYKLRLLLNFHVAHMHDGIVRLVNGL